MHRAKRIFEDVEAYKANGVDGLIACGSQRSYFPTGLAYYVFARKQYDITLSFHAILKEYFETAFGSEWESFADYLRGIADIFGDKYLEGEESADKSISLYYNPARAEKLLAIKAVTEKGMKLIEKCYNSSDRIKTASVRLLEYHAKYSEALAEVFALKADGKKEQAAELMERLAEEMNKSEIYTERYFDHYFAISFFRRLIRL